MFLASLKLTTTVLMIATYALSAGAVRLAIRDHFRQRHALARLTSFYSRLCARLFGMQVDLEGLENLRSEGRAPLILANHLSYLDVVLLSSIRPAVFVTSVEVRDTPFLGFMAKSGGSLFVERRSKWGLADELRMITDVLDSGIPVVIFPEGTSSNGENVLPFKSALLRAAESAGTRIVPTCLRYSMIDGKPVSPENRDRLFYYGDIDFFPHFIGLMRMRSSKIQIKILPAEQTAVRRKDLANQIRQRIVEAYV